MVSKAAVLAQMQWSGFRVRLVLLFAPLTGPIITWAGPEQDPPLNFRLNFHPDVLLMRLKFHLNFFLEYLNFALIFKKHRFHLDFTLHKN